MYIRAYWPKPELTEGKWTPPRKNKVIASKSRANSSLDSIPLKRCAKNPRTTFLYLAILAAFPLSAREKTQIQSTFGGGIGRNLINTGPTLLTVYGGLAWQQINYQEAVFHSPTQQVTSGLLGPELDLFRFDKTTLAVNANLLAAINDPGGVHFILNTSYYVKLWGKLKWNFTAYGNWDSRPPPGFVGSHCGATSGLSVTFGNH